MNRSTNRQFRLVAVCFLLSGFAALLYETVWLRQFAVLFGTSELALAVVLASYMGGLAIGAWAAGRFIDSVRRPLLTYGMLELGIAVSALCVPIGIRIAGALQKSWIGGHAELPDSGGLGQTVFRFATAFGLILIPTALMGATLPLLARHVVREDRELGLRIGALYAINTAGAVLGTLAAAFYWLPTFGLARTTWIGAAINLVVFAVVVVMVRSPSTSGEGLTWSRAKPNSVADRDGGDSRYRRMLLLVAIAGAVSFCCEIVFTRMIGHVLGGSVYAFATMLSGFLLGIALGGAIASRLATGRKEAATWFVYTQTGAAVCTLLAYHMIDRMVLWSWGPRGGAIVPPGQVIATILVLVPTATMIGATVPLAIRCVARDASESAGASARVYSWNVVGGIVGAIVTGVVLLPTLEFHATTAVAVLVSLLIAASSIPLFGINRYHVVLPVLALVLLASRFPKPPENVLRVSTLTGRLSEGEIVFNHVGKSATVTVIRNRGQTLFQTNGLPEAQLRMLGSGEIHRSAGYWLSGLPSMLRPSCESMLIVGLGGGVVAELVPPSIRSIDIVEIEPSVVDANRAIASQRNIDPLSDPRIRMVINDGRNALELSDKTYDVIVSQPSHPWTAGASHLYSREFDQLVHDHLEPGGIFLQWMDSGFIDTELLCCMSATLLDTFEHARLYAPAEGVLLFVASDAPIRPETSSIERSGQILADFNDEDRPLFERLGVVSPTHLLSLLQLDEATMREISHNASVITDEQNLLAMRSPRVMAGDPAEEIAEFLRQRSPITWGMERIRELCPHFEASVYLLRRTSADNVQWIRQNGLPLIDRPQERAFVQAKLLWYADGSGDWMDQLHELCDRYPQSSDLAFEFVSNRLLGSPVEITPAEEASIRRSLTARHRLVIELLEKLIAGDWMAARAKDADLANWSVDDVAYPIAVRLRIPWRLESPPGERKYRCEEAIGIIDRSAPFAKIEGLAYFRVLAAVNADRPYEALATTSELARMIERSLDRENQTSLAAGATNLARCFSVIQDERLFQQVPAKRYREVRSEVRSVLTRLSQIGVGPRG